MYNKEERLNASPMYFNGLISICLSINLLCIYVRYDNIKDLQEFCAIVTLAHA